MADEPIKVKIDNKAVNEKLLELAKRTENLRPLMKNIAGIFASSTEENFKEEGRPDKWTELAEITKENRNKIKNMNKKKGKNKSSEKENKWSGKILQISGQLAASVNTEYDDESVVIGSNKDYAAIHQLGGKAGKNKKVSIPARPYLQLTDEDFDEILEATENFLK